MAQQPNAQEWQQWLADNAGRLLLFARQQCRLAADAEDVLQEALVEVWQRTAAGGLPPLALVFATIRHRAIDRARSEDRRRLREDSGAVRDEAWFDASPEAAERRELVEAGLRELPDIFREVVTLKIWGELTFEEVAAVLEIPANTAASRYRYGLEQLRKNLKPVLV